MLANFAHIEKNEKDALRRSLRGQLPHFLFAPVPERLLASEIWRKAASVGLYASLPGEVDTAPLLENAWQEGKLVCLPRITDKNTHSMEFIPCASMAELTVGAFGLLEPAAAAPARWVDLLVVPALAFDRRGCRLGRGGGYYDRFLATHGGFATLRLGICHSRQVVERLPDDPWDIFMDALCTEEGITCL